MTERNKIIIGRREKVDFPELGLFDIEAKIDTGAYTTALHCHDIQVVNRDGRDVLCFKLLDPTHPEYNEKQQCFTSFSTKDIKNSFGEKESRYVIKTLVRIGRKRIRTVISLTDRGNMRYPVLIGRKMLRGKFMVDVSALYQTERKKRRVKKNKK